jgi:DnaA family protein
MRQLPLGVQLRTAAVFDNFYAGTNVEAVAALHSRSALPQWIWGASASGKSHLLQAACAATASPSAYVPLRLEVELPQTSLPPAALGGLEHLDLACIDDLDAIAGQESWERALFALFNAAAETGTRLLFAANGAPATLPWSLPDWASRAASCSVYQLRLLDDSERIEALRMRAQRRGLELPLETAEYLLKRMPRDQRTLFDLVDALDDAALVAQRRLTVPFVRAALNLA